MTVGLSAVNTADKLLNTIGRTGTTFTAGLLYVKLHTGDPGSAGTANASTVTTRYAATFSASSAGSMALTAMGGTYAMTGTETISHISLHDAATAGNFLWSVALTASKSVINGDTLSLTSLTLAFTPIAA
jgi:hypothetical protein